MFVLILSKIAIERGGGDKTVKFYFDVGPDYTNVVTHILGCKLEVKIGKTFGHPL